MLLKPTYHTVCQPFVVGGLLLAISWAGETKAAEDEESSHGAVAERSRDGLVVGDKTYRYTLGTSLWTTHFNPQPEHNNTQRFLGVERHGSNFVTEPLQARFAALESADPMLGLAYFKNSYHQSTLFAYAGLSKAFWEHRAVTARIKVSAGFIHGYRNQFQYKVPLNNLGTSPAAIPSLTLHYRQFNTEMILFGTSGLMLNVGYSF